MSLFKATLRHDFSIACRLKEKKKAHCVAMTVYANYRKLKERDSPDYLGMIQRSFRYARSNHLNPILLL